MSSNSEAADPEAVAVAVAGKKPATVSLNDLPIHGGDICAASKRYGVPFDQWIDLSTGINPVGFPFTGIPNSAYQNLPYLQPGFMEAAARFYGDERALAVPGSQPVIQLLPQLLGGRTVLVPEIGYQEHAECWAKTDTVVERYPSLCVEKARAFITESLGSNSDQHLLVINPNNPSGIVFDNEQLQLWAAMLSNGYYLIVDEAFIETSQVASLLGSTLPSNAIVLRSFGKYFGLAGLRLGFVFAHEPMLRQLQEGIGLWQVNGPSQAIAIQAFNDNDWQSRARQIIHDDYAKTVVILQPLMEHLGATRLTSPGLYLSHLVDMASGTSLYTYLANNGVLTRLVKVDSASIIVRSGIVCSGNKTETNRFSGLIKQYESTL